MYVGLSVYPSSLEAVGWSTRGARMTAGDVCGISRDAEMVGHRVAQLKRGCSGRLLISGKYGVVE